MTTLRISLAQFNPLVGDLRGNAQKIAALITQSRDEFNADLVIFPELALTGYPPEDLLLRDGFLKQCAVELDKILSFVQGIDVVLGVPVKRGGYLRNCALFLRNERVEKTYEKRELPNYSVFDEKRYFRAGHAPCIIEIKDIKIGLTVCEDIWLEEPARDTKAAGAQLIININASPYHLGKNKRREAVLAQRVNETGLPIIYLNQVGGQDELVFDGESFFMDAKGNIPYRAPAFVEALQSLSFSVPQLELIETPAATTAMSDEESIYQALVLGIRDYARKNSFCGAILGLSGGIDSALTLALAVDAVSAENVEAIMMPSRYTSLISVEDARSQADALGVKLAEISIAPLFDAFQKQLAPIFSGLAADTTEENLQARARGMLLMAVSNKKGFILLSTGNKSEMAVGYATLYGDMAGGFAPLKDVFKQWVYRLARYRNSLKPIIPERVLTRAPSAELKPDQTDQDSLPPYDELDGILELFIEQDQSVPEIVAAGYSRETVERIAAMVLRNEYKRRQAPPGVRISRRAFGKDRRYPITSGYRERDGFDV